jgi:hypothetical protein
MPALGAGVVKSARFACYLRSRQLKLIVNAITKAVLDGRQITEIKIARPSTEERSQEARREQREEQAGRVEGTADRR